MGRGESVYPPSISPSATSALLFGAGMRPGIRQPQGLAADFFPGDYPGWSSSRALSPASLGGFLLKVCFCVIQPLLAAASPQGQAQQHLSYLRPMEVTCLLERPGGQAQGSRSTTQPLISPLTPAHNLTSSSWVEGEMATLWQCSGTWAQSLPWSELPGNVQCNPHPFTGE